MDWMFIRQQDAQGFMARRLLSRLVRIHMWMYGSALIERWAGNSATRLLHPRDVVILPEG